MLDDSQIDELVRSRILQQTGTLWRKRGPKAKRRGQSQHVAYRRGVVMQALRTSLVVAGRVSSSELKSSSSLDNVKYINNRLGA